MANILLKDDFTIKTTQLSQAETYELSELLFYIPDIFSCSRAFVSLTDSDGMTDVIPLQFSGNHQAYKVYRVNYANAIRVKSGTMTLKILLFDNANKECNISVDSVDVAVYIHNYKAAHNLAVTMELHSSMKDMYDKIVKLTNMNIELYEKITKGVMGNDDN